MSARIDLLLPLFFRPLLRLPSPTLLLALRLRSVENYPRRSLSNVATQRTSIIRWSLEKISNLAHASAAIAMVPPAPNPSLPLVHMLLAIMFPTALLTSPSTLKRVLEMVWMSTSPIPLAMPNIKLEIASTIILAILVNPSRACKGLDLVARPILVFM